MPSLLLCFAVGAAALQPTPAPSSRRAVLTSAAAAAVSVASPFAVSAKSKDYMTMDEYNKLKKEELASENLYGLFSNLKNRASQTGEFDKLAESDKLSEVSKLALAWDSNIRKELLDKANDQLKGADKEAGSKISKIVLEDLKNLDKLAKAGDKAAVPAQSAALRGHVLDFVALEPQKIKAKYGDLTESYGTLGDL